MRTINDRRIARVRGHVILRASLVVAVGYAALFDTAVGATCAAQVYGVGSPPASYVVGSFGVGALGAGDLAAVDPATMLQSALASGLPGGIENYAAASDSVTGELFYVVPGPELAVVDTATALLIRTVPLTENVLALEYDEGGARLLALVDAGGVVLGARSFAVRGTRTDLVSIDTFTGASTLIASDLRPGGLVNALTALDSDLRRLYYLAATRQLVTVDIDTGVSSASSPIIGELLALDFDPGSNELYGLATVIVGSQIGGNQYRLFGSGGNDLVRVDPISGTLTVITGAHPGGITNFVAAISCVTSTFVYESAAGELVALDLTTGGLLAVEPEVSGLLAIRSGSSEGCLVATVGRQQELLAWKPGGTDVAFTWLPDPTAAEYHLNRVDAKTDLADPGAHQAPVIGGVGVSRCEVAGTNCTVTAELADTAARRFYQLLGACGPGGDAEGPP